MPALEWRELSASPAVKQSQPTPSVKPSSVVYWLRVVLAILAGAVTELLHVNVSNFGDLASIVGIAVGVLFYMASVCLVRYVFRYGEAELRGKNRYITLGGGTFVVVWIMVTVLFYTLGV